MIAIPTSNIVAQSSQQPIDDSVQFFLASAVQPMDRPQHDQISMAIPTPPPMAMLLKQQRRMSLTAPTHIDESDAEDATSKTSSSTVSSLSSRGSSIRRKPKSKKSHSKGHKRGKTRTSKSARSRPAGHAPTKKRVHFPEDESSCFQVVELDDVPPASQMSSDEKLTFWWNLDQVENFRKNASKVSKKSLPQSHGQVLNDLMKMCERSEDEDIDLSDFLEGQRSLITWVIKNCRGLEKRTSPELREDARDRKTMLVDAINVLQLTDAFDDDTKAEKIRFCSERCSVPSRFWARAMGLADFLSRIHEDCDDSSSVATGSVYTASCH